MVSRTPHNKPQKRSVLWSWLYGVVAPEDGSAAHDSGHERAATETLPEVPAFDRDENQPARSVLIPFPIYGEALLVKLADALRSRVADRGDRDRLLLTLSRCPGSRLLIDRAAYIDFDADRGAFCLAIEAESDTRVILETTDFDTLVRFVVLYVTERPSGSAVLEAAS